jgi:hypothetical protein
MNKRQKKKKFGEPRRLGLTEKQIKRMSRKQQEEWIAMWFPLRRAIYPNLITKDIFIVTPKGELNAKINVG